MDFKSHEAASTRPSRRKTFPLPAPLSGPVAASQTGSSSLSSSSGHVCSVSTVHDVPVILSAGVQAVRLYVHDDFLFSDDSPIDIHLCRDTVHLGMPSYTVASARHIYRACVLDFPDKTGYGDEDEELEGRANDSDGEDENHETHVAPPEGGDPVATAFQRKHKKPRSGFRHILGVVAITLVAVFLAPSRHDPSPVPEYTLLKPLDPSPEIAFADLIQRRAAAPRAVVASGATDYQFLVEAWRADWAVLNSPSNPAGRPEPVKVSTGGGWPQQKAAANDDENDEPYYHGPAHARLSALCDEFEALIETLPEDVVAPLKNIMVSFWGQHAMSGLFSAARGLETILGDGGADTHHYAHAHTPQIDGPASPAAFSPSGESLPTHDNNDNDALAINSSLAIAVLQQLSKRVTLPQRFSRRGVGHIQALDKNLSLVINTGIKLLEPRWEQWRALNRPASYRTSSSSSSEPQITPSEKDLQQLASLGDRARATSSRCKEMQRRFFGPAAECLAVTGPDLDHLKGWMDGLIAGRGWTRLVPARHDSDEDKWVLEWYYFSPRPDLLAWLKSLGRNITAELNEFAEESKQALLEQLKNRVRPDDSWTYGGYKGGNDPTGGFRDKVKDFWNAL
ncbi:hypothetical protein B0H63DRAFT_545086 [Podospora didyma]|uniref:Uncharacterized protein n=1 Tax=Podospora didyma TaxID=330526 RepID=A0AAE0NG71_9PEZI|nr:hypothetical protein B0H63DRAFT_545086 [Podospora didyma]